MKKVKLFDKKFPGMGKYWNLYEKVKLFDVGNIWGNGEVMKKFIFLYYKMVWENGNLRKSCGLIWKN